MNKQEYIEMANETKKEIWNELGLDKRSIIFNVSDIEGYGTYIGRGIVDCSDDLYEDDEYIDFSEEYPEEKQFHCEEVTSYLLGDGEADHAGYYDRDVLEDLKDTMPKHFYALLDLFADCLCVVKDFDIDNPWYEEDVDDDDEDVVY